MVFFRLVIDAVHAPADREPAQRARPALRQPDNSVTLQDTRPMSGLVKLFEILCNRPFEERRDPFAEDFPGERIADGIVQLEIEKDPLRHGLEDRRCLP